MIAIISIALCIGGNHVESQLGSATVDRFSVVFATTDCSHQFGLSHYVGQQLWFHRRRCRCHIYKLSLRLFDNFFSGGAGAIVAARLSENPSVNVLLLEAGGSENEITDIPSNYYELLGNPEYDWYFPLVNQPNLGQAYSMPAHLSVGKVLGKYENE